MPAGASGSAPWWSMRAQGTSPAEARRRPIRGGASKNVGEGAGERLYAFAPAWARAVKFLAPAAIHGAAEVMIIRTPRRV